MTINVRDDEEHDADLRRYFNEVLRGYQKHFDTSDDPFAIVRAKIFNPVGFHMALPFGGEQFQPQLIKDISDFSCKMKGQYFFEKLGCVGVRVDETQRTGEDLFIDGRVIPTGLMPFLSVVKGEHSFELTTRTALTMYENHTWALNDSYNIPERRVKTHYGPNKEYTALVEFPWWGLEGMEAFYDRILTEREKTLNIGLNDLDKERYAEAIALMAGDFERWRDFGGCSAVMVLFPDIIVEYNKQKDNMTTTTDPRAGAKQSFVTRMPWKKKIRFWKFEGKIGQR